MMRFQILLASLLITHQMGALAQDEAQILNMRSAGLGYVNTPSQDTFGYEVHANFTDGLLNAGVSLRRWDDRDIRDDVVGLYIGTGYDKYVQAQLGYVQPETAVGRLRLTLPVSANMIINGYYETSINESDVDAVGLGFGFYF